MRRTVAFALPLLLAVAALIAVPLPAVAQQENGRYQVVPLPPTQTTSGYNALITDTRDGHLWSFFNAPGTDGKFHEGVRYLGKVKEGENLKVY
jgi:hypothetical protein